MVPIRVVVTRRDIVTALRSIELSEGQNVFVHSGTDVFGHVVDGSQTIGEAILDAVGRTGKLMSLSSYCLVYRVDDVDLEKPPIVAT